MKRGRKSEKILPEVPVFEKMFFKRDSAKSSSKKGGWNSKTAYGR
jgi:hypothetical protein